MIRTRHEYCTEKASTNIFLLQMGPGASECCAIRNLVYSEHLSNHFPKPANYASGYTFIAGKSSPNYII